MDISPPSVGKQLEGESVLIITRWDALQGYGKGGPRLIPLHWTYQGDFNFSLGMPQPTLSPAPRFPSAPWPGNPGDGSRSITEPAKNIVGMGQAV